LRAAAYRFASSARLPAERTCRRCCAFALREVAPPLGLVDDKVCAIDETRSGLRLVWRRELRK